MTTNICFICLDFSPNKVCNTCECYAHPKCWGKYLESNIKFSTFIFDSSYSVVSKISCPICKTANINPKRLTRSDTVMSRLTILNLDIMMYFEILNDENENIIYDNIFKIVAKNKDLLKRSESLDNFVKKRLNGLYHDGWKQANIHYLKIYGEQVV